MDKHRFYSKRDVMEMFGMGSDWALRFMRFAKMNGCGVQINRRYYIKADKLDEMMDQYMGLQVHLPAC